MSSNVETSADPMPSTADRQRQKERMKAAFSGLGQATEAKQQKIASREAAEIGQMRPRKGRKSIAPRDADVRMRMPEGVKHRGQQSALRMGITFTDLVIELLTKHLNERGE